MKLALLGVGTALPEHSLDQGSAGAILARMPAARDPDQEAGQGEGENPHARSIERICRSSGVERRHSVLLDGRGEAGLLEFYRVGAAAGAEPGTAVRMGRYAERAPELALSAAGRALRASEEPVERITDLITVSCTGFAAPGVDLALIEGLGLSPEVARTHVGFMGCHGALNALRVARATAAAKSSARILIVAVELCSLHLQRNLEQGRAAANALFADGAAAVVAGAADTTGGREAGWNLLASGSRIFPRSAGDMSWGVGDTGFEMTLAASVPGRIGAHLRPWLEAWLAEQGLTLGEIRSFAVHPGGPRILQAVETALELPPEAIAVSREVLARHGNMSSPTILFILERMARAGARGPCLALAFGPGLAAEAALLD